MDAILFLLFGDPVDRIRNDKSLLAVLLSTYLGLILLRQQVEKVIVIVREGIVQRAAFSRPSPASSAPSGRGNDVVADYPAATPSGRNLPAVPLPRHAHRRRTRRHAAGGGRRRRNDDRLQDGPGLLLLGNTVAVAVAALPPPRPPIGCLLFSHRQRAPAAGRRRRLCTSAAVVAQGPPTKRRGGGRRRKPATDREGRSVPDDQP